MTFSFLYIVNGSKWIVAEAITVNNFYSMQEQSQQETWSALLSQPRKLSQLDREKDISNFEKTMQWNWDSQVYAHLTNCPNQVQSGWLQYKAKFMLI